MDLTNFQPINPTGVTMYTCGPTVYDYAHIGNWRSFLTADLVKRTLKYNGYSVKHIINLTDVDDKTITASHKAGLPLASYTKKYEDLFYQDLESLNIEAPAKFTPATEYIPQMISLVEKLLATGHAYPAEDGIYFKVSSFTPYGELSHQPIDDNSERDFALWKFESPEDNGNAWEASFGRGRPGWHIECSAMSMAELGEQIDIHTGGSDLLFPHHENEIAQSEAATGKTPFVRHWIHNAFVNVDGKKMSKSLGNIYTLNDLGEHQISPLAYRYWLLTAHYSTPINFTWEAAGGAQIALNKITNQVRALGKDKGQVDENYRQQFLTAINKLNTPIAIALIINLLDSTLPASDKLATILDFDQVLGLGLADLKPLEIPPEIQQFVADREAARQAQNWALADQLRGQIEAAGFQVNDTHQGPYLSLS